jgi:hypothetical protein
MSLDDDISSTNTLTLLDEYMFKSDLLTMMSDTGPQTNSDELKRRAKAVLSLHPWSLYQRRIENAGVSRYRSLCVRKASRNVFYKVFLRKGTWTRKLCSECHTERTRERRAAVEYINDSKTNRFRDTINSWSAEDEIIGLSEVERLIRVTTKDQWPRKHAWGERQEESVRTEFLVKNNTNSHSKRNNRS